MLFVVGMIVYENPFPYNDFFSDYDDDDPHNNFDLRRSNLLSNCEHCDCFGGSRIIMVSSGCVTWNFDKSRGLTAIILHFSF